jgi:hypothetical protein
LVLAKNAHSPRLRRHFFGKIFSVEAIPPTPSNVNRPQSSLENLVADALSDRGFKTLDALGKAIDINPTTLKEEYLDNDDPFGNKTFVKAPIHCECALIHHFNKPDKRDTTGIPPVGYLGVSKLSCSACKIFIDVWNQTNTRSQNFLTRGSHGKCYFPWALPPSLDEETATAFVASITDYIGKRLKKDGVVKLHIKHRRLTESDYPSSDSDGETLPVMNPNYATQFLSNLRSENVLRKSGKSVVN